MKTKKDDTCTWAQNSDLDSLNEYYTSCNRSFELYDGTPEDNGMKFCCYCGGSLAQLLAQDEQE